MNHDDAIARQMHVALETVCAAGRAVIECGDRILGPQGGAPAVRVDQES